MKKKKKIPKEKAGLDFESRFGIFFNNRKNLILIIILVANLLFNFLLFDPKLFTGGDNAVYIVLSESIISGKGYRNVSHPDEPLHSQYPFGLPLLITPVLLFFGHNYILMKIIVFLLGAGALFILWKILRIASPLIAVSVLLMTAFNPDFINFSHWVLSEIPYLFFTIAGIFFFEKSLRDDTRGIKYLGISALMFAYAFFTRPTGIALFAAGFLILLLKRKFRNAVIFLIIIIISISPWLIRNVKIGTLLGQSQNILITRSVYDVDSGTLTIPEFLVRSLKNVEIYFLEIIPTTTFYIFSMVKLGPIYHYICALIIVVFLFYGFSYAIRKKISIMHTYFAFYFLTVLPWHEYVSSIRYFLPILPIFFYFFCVGLTALCKKFFPKWKYALPVIICLFINCSYIYYMLKETPISQKNLSRYIKGNPDAGYSEDWVRYYQCADWIRTNTPENSIVLSRKPELFYLRSKRKSMTYPYTYNQEEMKTFLFDSNIDYVVIDRFYWTGTTRRYLIPVIDDNIDMFEVVYMTPPPETYVLKIKK